MYVLLDAGVDRGVVLLLQRFALAEELFLWVYHE
jgi:hypothetical protein